MSNAVMHQSKLSRFQRKRGANAPQSEADVQDDADDGASRHLSNSLVRSSRATDVVAPVCQCGPYLSSRQAVGESGTLVSLVCLCARARARVCVCVRASWRPGGRARTNCCVHL